MTNRGHPRTPPNNYGGGGGHGAHPRGHSEFEYQLTNSRGGHRHYDEQGPRLSKKDRVPSRGFRHHQGHPSHNSSVNSHYKSNARTQTSQSCWSPRKSDLNHEHESYSTTTAPLNKGTEDFSLEMRGSERTRNGSEVHVKSVGQLCGGPVSSATSGANDAVSAPNSNSRLPIGEGRSELKSRTRRVAKCSGLKSIVNSTLLPNHDGSGEGITAGIEGDQNSVHEGTDSSIDSESVSSTSAAFHPEWDSLKPIEVSIEEVGAEDTSLHLGEEDLSDQDLQDFEILMGLFPPSANVGPLPVSSSQTLVSSASELQNLQTSTPAINNRKSENQWSLDSASDRSTRDFNSKVRVGEPKKINNSYGDPPGFEPIRAPVMSFKNTFDESALNGENSSFDPNSSDFYQLEKKKSDNEFVASLNVKRFSEPPLSTAETTGNMSWRDPTPAESYRTRKSSSPHNGRISMYSDAPKNKCGILGDSPAVNTINLITEGMSNMVTRPQDDKKAQLRRQQIMGPGSFAKSLEKSGSRGGGKVKFVKATALTQHFVNPPQGSLADRLYRDVDTQSPQKPSATVEEWGRNFQSQYSLKNTCNETYIDSHCHIDFLYKRHNLSKDCKLQFFNEKHFPYQPESFDGFVSVYCEPYAFQNFKSYPFLLNEPNVNCVAAFGIHPHSAHLYNDRVERELRIALDHEKCTALGEIGLDYSDRASEAPRDVQKEVFIKQLQIALDKKKNVVLHCRDADDDMNEILKKYCQGITMHRHCFTENRRLLKYLLKTFPNMYIGFTNLISLKSADDPRQAAYEMPLDRLLLETDAPYFLPPFVPTKYSHPAMAVYVAEKIAELKDISLQTVMKHARLNTRIVYDI